MKISYYLIILLSICLNIYSQANTEHLVNNFIPYEINIVENIDIERIDTLKFKLEVNDILNQEVTKVTYHWTMLGLIEGWNLAHYVAGAYNYVFSNSMEFNYLILKNCATPNAVIEIGKKISEDIIFDIIKRVINHPEKASLAIAFTTYKDGHKSYKQAYDLYKKYKENRSLNFYDSFIFLYHHYNFGKIGISKDLMVDARNNNPNNEKFSDREIQFLINNISISDFNYENEYVNTEILDGFKDNILRIFNIYKLLQESEIGLMNYRPYLKFQNKISNLYEEYIDIIKKSYKTSHNEVVQNLILGSELINKDIAFRFITNPKNKINPEIYSYPDYNIEVLAFKKYFDKTEKFLIFLYANKKYCTERFINGYEFEKQRNFWKLKIFNEEFIEIGSDFGLRNSEIDKIGNQKYALACFPTFGGSAGIVTDLNLISKINSDFKLIHSMKINDIDNGYGARAGTREDLTTNSNYEYKNTGKTYYDIIRNTTGYQINQSIFKFSHRDKCYKKAESLSPFTYQSSYYDFDEYIIDFKKAVKNNDPDQLLKMIELPFKDWRDFNKLDCKNAKEFKYKFSSIFSLEFKNSIKQLDYESGPLSWGLSGKFVEKDEYLLRSEPYIIFKKTENNKYKLEIPYLP